MKQVGLYTDGSCLGNPGAGGWAFILQYAGHVKEGYGAHKHTTNNRMELQAVLEGLAVLQEPCEVHLHTDSQYVVNAINAWIKGWVKKDWRNVKNSEMWIEYLKLASKHVVTANWIKGHAGHEQNERCDHLARTAAENIRNA